MLAKGGKGGKGLVSGSRTTFLSVKKFRFSRVQNGALIAGTILILAALVWSALYFFR
jgi:hypothetical protein